MNNTIKLFIANIPAIILLVITGYMIYADKDSWGWVLASALICCHTLTTTKSE